MNIKFFFMIYILPHPKEMTRYTFYKKGNSGRLLTTKIHFMSPYPTQYRKSPYPTQYRKSSEVKSYSPVFENNCSIPERFKILMSMRFLLIEVNLGVERRP